MRRPIARSCLPAVWAIGRRSRHRRRTTGRRTITMRARQRFSPLKQITPANVSRLQPAWTFDTGVTGHPGHAARHQRRDVRAAGKDVIALSRRRREGHLAIRRARRGQPARRVVLARRSRRRRPPVRWGRATGCWRSMPSAASRPTDSAKSGFVDLKASVRGEVDGGFSLASPPAIYRDIVITGGNNGEQSPSSACTATSADGTRAPESCSGRSTPCRARVSRASRRGKAKAGRIDPDQRLGVLHGRRRTRYGLRAIGSPTSDYYGGDRKGANLYGNSLVALDATTGSSSGTSSSSIMTSGTTTCRRAGADRCEAQRPHDPGGCRDHEDGTAVHLRSRHGRADLRHGRAAGAAKHRARRKDLADAAFPAQAGAARAEYVRSGKDFYTLDAGARARTARSSGTRTGCTPKARTRRPASMARW